MKTLRQARAALAWLVPGALLSAYLIWTDRLVIPMAPPGDGAQVMEKGRFVPRTMRPSGAAGLPVRPPNRPLDSHLELMVNPLSGDRVRTSEQKLWEALISNPQKGLLYYHLAQIYGLRKEPTWAVQMLRLARKRGLPAVHFTQPALLGEQAMDAIMYDPIFMTYVRGLPESKQ